MFQRFFCLLTLALINTINAAEFRGVVIDKISGDPLVGASVVCVENKAHYAITGLDGSFVIKGISQGDYNFEISYLSFRTRSLPIKLNENGAFSLTIQLEPEVSTLASATVFGARENGSEASARASEKYAENVINVVSSKEIEISPDLTVANVVQRVSGVSLERNNNGDGQYAIVRGMDKRYNYTLVNGIKIPSPDPKNRYVPLDIFPSDLLERLEVSKSLTPDMEGDAIGGVIDMKLKDAPNRFVINVNVGSGYNSLFLERPYRYFDGSTVNMQSPRQMFGDEHRATIDEFSRENVRFTDYTPMPNQIYGLSIGNRFFENRLGVLVAGSYQNTFRGANSIFLPPDVNREDNTPFYDKVEIRRFSAQQIRSGVHSKIDYRLNENHKFDLYNAYIQLRDLETRSIIDTNLRIGRAAQGPGSGRIREKERSRLRVQQVYNSTLQGTHSLTRNFGFDWSAVFSKALNDEPDLAELVFERGASFNNEGQQVVTQSVLDRDFQRRWMSNSDEDWAYYHNFNYKFDEFMGGSLRLKAGGMYRHKNRENFFDRYLLRADPSQQFKDDELGIDALSWRLETRIGTPTDPLNYTSVENVLAYYGQFTYLTEKFQVLAGLRSEATDFSWITNAPVTVEGRVGSISYSDLLPSIHLKIMRNKKENIRASYFASLSRPNFFEVIPYEINEDDFRERGNPFLQRTTADNFDVRYELYPNSLDQFLVGIFYKTIQNPIEYALVTEAQATFLQPNNFGTAVNSGLEVDYTHYFKDFGVRAYYTFTDSRITTSKQYRFRDLDNNTLTSVDTLQTRPLQGQSRHIANVSLLYKNPRSKTDVQIAMVYTGSRIISVSPYYENDIWQQAFTQLDLSVEQAISKNIRVYIKINNLLDTPLRAEIRLPNNFNAEQVPYLDVSETTLVREDFYRISAFAGIKFNL